MKNFFSPFAKLIAVAACALTLGSCSRAEYAMLPKGSSYHGVSRVATPVPAAETATVATPTLATEPAAIAPQATPEATVATLAPAAKPAAKAAQPVAAPAASVSNIGTASTIAAPAHKLNVLQRIAVNKMTRKMDKLMQNSATARQHDNTASTTRSGGISGNLRIGIILVLVGVLIGIISPLVGTIVAIIGLIFIILWLLDQM